MQDKAKLGKDGISGGRRLRHANSAKQSQFLDFGLRIWDCGFRKVWGPPPDLAGPTLQTNPIWAEWPARSGAGRESQPGRDGAKQSQFWPGEREGQVPCRKGVMVHRTCNRLPKNKAKLGQDGESGWMARGRSLLCETKPILPIADCGFKTDLRRAPPAAAGPEAGCTNKPNSDSANEEASALWKRNYGKSYMQSASAKQSQFRGSPAVSGRRNAQNKPNLARLGQSADA
jgi:hypothetical protein